jgi:hypothetical protein
MKKKWLLGYTKVDRYGSREPVYLEDFSWDCEWYWGGGYIGNKNFHAHFDGAFLSEPDSRGHCLGSFYDPWTRLPEYLEESNVSRIKNGASVWEDLSFFLDDPQYNANEWWRIKDLFKQFYALRAAAEVFHSGGHCTSKGRADAEISPEMEATINKHISEVIIPEIRKAMDKGNK